LLDDTDLVENSKTAKSSIQAGDCLMELAEPFRSATS
jgi:hypothetical protein